ncbi:LytTR family DNA-binding domain-containing protein [Tissierella sp. MB52-C2]|uniref:LytR/AlgR family response regulator transcription factor n=1 Tax=Tissierella sp. MB52-C2 TaxID=3070999 RepID=UPI00280AAFD6|nr:LytTR family DNA-binding domain-containing protein [Tissierella sp. MB52-C2]WMM24664.1 LytTR family DNA-binding domain-containing protein [Tissierella sp. MB52-C2]
MSEIINIAICDDEKIQVKLLETYVINWADKNNLRINIECFYSGESFEFSWSMDKKYNILLLDIEMAGINGVDLAKKIRQEDNLLNIIFITAIPDYIGEGYEVDAINYLIKPIVETKLYECLDKAKKKIYIEEKIILVDVEGETIRIKEKDIIYIEAFSHSIDIYTIDKKYTTRKNIGVIEKELDEKLFIRCHRSYIVGLMHINRIGKTDIKLDNKDTIPVSRRLYSKVNMEFIRYFRGGVDE